MNNKKPIGGIAIDTGTLGDGYYTVSSGAYIDSTSTTVTFTPIPNFDLCSKCKQYEEVFTRYNWGDNKKLERIICKKCNTATLDKYYGLDNNIITERILYDKKTT